MIVLTCAVVWSKLLLLRRRSWKFYFCSDKALMLVFWKTCGFLLSSLMLVLFGELNHSEHTSCWGYRTIYKHLRHFMYLSFTLKVFHYFSTVLGLLCVVEQCLGVFCCLLKLSLHFPRSFPELCVCVTFLTIYPQCTWAGLTVWERKEAVCVGQIKEWWVWIGCRSYDYGSEKNKDLRTKLQQPCRETHSIV